MREELGRLHHRRGFLLRNDENIVPYIVFISKIDVKVIYLDIFFQKSSIKLHPQIYRVLVMTASSSQVEDGASQKRLQGKDINTRFRKIAWKTIEKYNIGEDMICVRLQGDSIDSRSVAAPDGQLFQEIGYCRIAQTSNDLLHATLRFE